MSKAQYRIRGGLREEDLANLHEKVLSILENIGLEVGNQELLQKLNDQQQLKIEGSRVKIDPSLVDKFVATKREESTAFLPGNNYTIDGPGALPFYQEDPISGNLQGITQEAGIRLTRLMDALYDEGIRGSAAGLAQEIAPKMRPVTACKISLENTRTPSATGVTSIKEADIVHEMYQVIGKENKGTGIFILNPLRIEGNELDIALHLLKKNPGLDIYVHSMPLLGVSVPIYLTGAFTESVAAVLGGAVLISLITEGKITYDISTIFPYDMRTNSIAYGTPEHLLSFLIGAQINEYYGMPVNRVRSLICNAVRSGEEASSLRGLQTMAAAFYGFRNFVFGGLLGVDKIFSPVQLLVDIEIVKYAMRVAEGFSVTEETYALEAIREVGPIGDFLGHNTTVSGYRELLWQPQVFENVVTEKGLKQSPHFFREKIARLIEEKIKESTFELPEDQRKELDSIVKKAEKIL